MDGLDQINLEQPGQQFLHGHFQIVEVWRRRVAIQRLFAFSHFITIKCARHMGLEEFVELVVLVAYVTAAVVNASHRDVHMGGAM
jgi:hypothetical protein